MTENRIFILGGPVNSGKTTRLINWTQNRKDVSGILTPVINGQRFFMNAETQEIFKMEADPGESNVLTVGKYVFSKLAFDRAKEVLHKASNQEEGWLIIDEVGPLELKGNGFYDELKEILSVRTLQTNRQNNNLKIVLVVRESLIDEVVKFWGIEEYEEFMSG